MRERLRVVRRRQGWTQEKIAARLGIARSTYTQYELGLRDPSLSTAQRIAYLLGEPVDVLFFDPAVNASAVIRRKAVP